MNCPQCESPMLVEVFGVANPIRCAACGTISTPPDQNSSEVNRQARRSLWLGVSSIFLLFLTGIPAIWYGVHSLLQMRFIRSTRSDKKAAAAGIALGVVFGIIGTTVVAVVAGFAIFFMTVIEETSDPDRMNEILAEIGSIDVPETINLIEANQFTGQFKRVNWKDSSNAAGTEDSSNTDEVQLRMRLIRANRGGQVGDMQISFAKSRFQLYRDMEVEPGSQKVETLSWQFDGQLRDVTKTTQKLKDKEFQAVQYFATSEGEGTSLVFALIVNVRERGKYSEAQVKEMFESFKRTQ